MIDPATIEEYEACDETGVFACGLDDQTGTRRWALVPAEVLVRHGRGDILEACGLSDEAD